MKHLSHSKLFVIDYTIESGRETFILADNIEDALKNHKQKFPSHHRNIKLIQFLSGNPMITEKIASREFEDIATEIKPEIKQLESEEAPETVADIIERESK